MLVSERQTTRRCSISDIPIIYCAATLINQRNSASVKRSESVTYREKSGLAECRRSTSIVSACQRRILRRSSITAFAPARL